MALAEGLTGLALLIGLQYAVAFTSVRWTAFAHAVRAEPALLVRHGEPLDKAMKRERVTLDDVKSAIRASGGHDIGEADSVIIESDGTLSVVMKDEGGSSRGSGKGSGLES